VIRQLAAVFGWDFTMSFLSVYLYSDAGKIIGGVSPPVFFNQLAVTQPMTAFVDGGHYAYAAAATSTGHFENGQLTISGYLLDCTAAPCSPMAP
jgi:hypothetical protein